MKITKIENFLVVQSLGLNAVTAVSQVQSLVKELRSRKMHDNEDCVKYTPSWHEHKYFCRICSITGARDMLISRRSACPKSLDTQLSCFSASMVRIEWMILLNRHGLFLYADLLAFAKIRLKTKIGERRYINAKSNRRDYDFVRYKCPFRRVKPRWFQSW